MKKYIQIFSDGSITFNLDNNNVGLKKIKISEKDHRNLFLKEKKTFYVNPSDYSSKYKNKYL
jgi:hypothetical protein